MRSLFLFFVLIPFFLRAQPVLELSIKVSDPKRKPMVSASIKLKESTSGETLEKKADGTGSATFTLDHGKVWKVFVDDYDMERSVEMPESGKMIHSMNLTYNPALAEREKKQSTDRTGYSWVRQNNQQNTRAPAGKAILHIRLMSRSGVPQRNRNVRILLPMEKKGFEATTNGSGIATFLVEPGKSYDIDVEGTLNIGFADIGKRPGLMVTQTLQYDEPELAEQRYGDTVVQRIDKESAATGRAFYSITVERYGEGPAANETVYMHEIHGKDVYVGYTDEQGTVNFLLPLGKKYMVHFNYERDVDVVDLSRAKGYVTGSMQLTYRPDPRLEHPELFVPKKEELFLVGFEQFLKKQYPKPKGNKRVGIHLNWGNTFNENSREALLEIGYTAQGSGTRVPGNYSFVLDRSGSMAGYYRIEMLKASMKELVKRLDPQDYVSLYIYDDDMQELFPHQLLGNNKSKLIEAIEGIEAGGGTNMLEAMKKAYESVNKVYDLNRNNSVILLTDGYDRNEPEVLKKVQEAYNDRILCTAIGVGESYNYPLMQILAERGKGWLLHVADSADFDRVFLKVLFGQMQPVALQVKLEIEYPAPFDFRHLYGKDPAFRKTGLVRYELPVLYAGDNQVALALFELKKANPEIEKLPITVRIRYRETSTGEEITVEEKIYPKWEPYTGMKPLVVEAELKKLYAMAEINRALKVMSDAYTEGRDDEARQALETCMKNLEKLYPKAEDSDVKELMDKMDQYLQAFKNLSEKKRLQQQQKLRVK